MSFLFGRVKSFLKNLEAEIDNDFSKNQNNYEDQDGEDETNLISDFPSSPEKQQKVLEENNNVESELSKEQKQEKLRQLKEELILIEKESEALSKNLSKYQDIQSKMGQQGNELLKEFNKRMEKFNQQKEILTDEKEHLISEESKSKDLENLSNAQMELKLVQQNIEVLENQIQTLNEEEEQMENDLDNLLDDIKEKHNEISKLEKKNQEFQKIITKIQSDTQQTSAKIPKAKDGVNKLLEVSADYEHQHQQCIKESQDFFSEKNKILSGISEIKEKIQKIDQEKQMAINQNRLSLVKAMKEFTLSKMQELDLKKQQITNQKQELLAMKSSIEAQHDEDVHIIENQISSTEIENKELQTKCDKSKEEFTALELSYHQQINYLESLFQENLSFQKSIKDRTNQQFAEIKEKQAEILSQVDSMNLEIDQYNNQYEALKQDNQQVIDEIQKNNESFSKILKEIEGLSVQKTNITSDYYLIKNKLDKLNEQLKKNNDTMMKIERKGKYDIEYYEKLIQEEKVKMEKMGRYGKMSRWKDLTKRCGALEREKEEILEKMKSERIVQKLFNQTLDLVAEKQENVDHLHELIIHEKSEFQRKLLLLLS